MVSNPSSGKGRKGNTKLRRQSSFSEDLVAAVEEIGAPDDVEEEDDVQVEEDAKTFSKRLQGQLSTAFVIGVLNTALTAFLAGWSPLLASYVALVKICVLLTWRFVTWRKAGKHYWMADMCYWANFGLALWLIGVLFFGWSGADSVRAFNSLYVFALGPLLWSVLAFNNRLAFQSPDMTVTTMIHLSPSLLLWSIRHNSSEHTSPIFLPFTPGHNSPPAADILADAFLLYAAWSLIYSLFMFVLRAKRIKDREYQTMWGYMMEPSRKSAIYQLLNRCTSVEALQKVLYMLLHATATALVMVPTPLPWSNGYVHMAMVAVGTTVAVRNAAGTYVRPLVEKEVAKRKGGKKE